MTQLMNDDTMRLRPVEPTDVDWLYALENDARLWAVTDTSAPLSRQLLWQYLKDYDGDIYRTRELRLVGELVADGTPVGTVDVMNFSPLNNRAELGLAIVEAQRGRGYGGHMMRLACDYAAHHLGLRQLYVHVPADNDASRRLCRAAGFEIAGTLRQWVKRGHDYHDVVIMQRFL